MCWTGEGSGADVRRSEARSRAPCRRSKSATISALVLTCGVPFRRATLDCVIRSLERLLHNLRSVWTVASVQRVDGSHERPGHVGTPPRFKQFDVNEPARGYVVLAFGSDGPGRVPPLKCWRGGTGHWVRFDHGQYPQPF